MFVTKAIFMERRPETRGQQNRKSRMDKRGECEKTNARSTNGFGLGKKESKKEKEINHYDNTKPDQRTRYGAFLSGSITRSAILAQWCWSDFA
jgi:hypothetical protein